MIFAENAVNSGGYPAGKNNGKKTGQANQKG
jgi:hypothetical protein